jgi:hypothetical protein
MKGSVCKYEYVLIGCQAGFCNQEKVFMRGFSTPFLRDCSRLDITGLAYYSLFSFVTKFTFANHRTGVALISSWLPDDAGFKASARGHGRSTRPSLSLIPWKALTIPNGIVTSRNTHYLRAPQESQLLYWRFIILSKYDLSTQLITRCNMTAV